MSTSEQKHPQIQSNADQPPPYDELVRLVGDLEPVRLAQIEQLQATVEEIEEAVAFASGEDDVMGEARVPLIGRVAEVYEIITADKSTDDE